MQEEEEEEEQRVGPAPGARRESATVQGISPLTRTFDLGVRAQIACGVYFLYDIRIIRTMYYCPCTVSIILEESFELVCAARRVFSYVFCNQVQYQPPTTRTGDLVCLPKTRSSVRR